jgi:hypothetical protein
VKATPGTPAQVCKFLGNESSEVMLYQGTEYHEQGDYYQHLSPIAETVYDNNSEDKWAALKGVGELERCRFSSPPPMNIEVRSTQKDRPRC